jgi:hypothetical protein
MSYPQNGWVNETPEQYLPRNEIPDQELPQFAKHEWSDHCYPLIRNSGRTRTVWLGNFPRLLRVITCMGKEHDTDKMTTIMRFPTADAQYAALMHFWKMYGLIERPPAARKYDKVTLEEKIKAFNLHHAGKNLTEISRELNRVKSCTAMILEEMNCDRVGRKYKALSKEDICRIRLMRQSGASLRNIAKKMGRTTSTIKYQVDRLKLVSRNPC